MLGGGAKIMEHALTWYLNTPKYLTNIVKLQAKSLDQELTLFYPCHKNNKKKKNNKKNKKNPSPKSIRRGSARRLKFDT